MDNIDRYHDRLVLKTTLIDTYELLLAFGQRHLPDRFHLKGTQAISIRDVIVRELVSSLLVHREYTDPRAGRIVISRDRIETTNPSRARFTGGITLDDFEPVPKNPLIANFFTQTGRAEDLGSGTRNLYKYAPLTRAEIPNWPTGTCYRTRLDDVCRRPNGERAVAPRR